MKILTVRRILSKNHSFLLRDMNYRRNSPSGIGREYKNSALASTNFGPETLMHPEIASPPHLFIIIIFLCAQISSGSVTVLGIFGTTDVVDKVTGTLKLL